MVMAADSQQRRQSRKAGIKVSDRCVGMGPAEQAVLGGRVAVNRFKPPLLPQHMLCRMHMNTHQKQCIGMSSLALRCHSIVHRQQCLMQRQQC